MKHLTNEPIGEDWYDGHAQAALAHRIAEEIRKPSVFVGPDGKEHERTVVMALEGPWGSGKSNVIKKVEGEIGYSIKGDGEHKNDAVFINYDLWMCRQDLSRKLILESIVGELTEKRKVLPKTFKDELVLLTGERVHGSVKETPRIGWPTWVVIGINVLLVGFSVYKSIRNLLGWELTSLQAIIGLALIGFCRFVESEYRKLKDCSFENFRHADEPSAKDFIAYLEKVAGALKESDESAGPNRLILVFDNLDRLNDDEIRKFWAATHVLFAERRDKRPSNMQVIIPYDRARMQRAFGSPQDGDEYIRKVVDKVFVMPPVIMTEWSKFLMDRMKLAFEEHDDAILVEAIRVFDWLHRPDDLTPRAMISFINDMVSVCEGLRYEPGTVTTNPIPLSIVALFVIGWRRFEKIEQVDNVELLIIGGGFIPKDAKMARLWYLGELNHSTQLAAVVYQLPEKAAADILTYQRVGASLDGNMTLGEICRQPGFHRVFSSVIKHVKQFESVPRALATIDTSDAQKYWDEYYDVKKDEIIMAHGSLPIITEGEALLFSHISKWQDYYMRLEEHLCHNSKAMFNENLQVQFAESVEKALKQVERTLVGSFVRPPVEPEEFVKYLKVAQENFRLLNMHCDCSKLDNWFDQNLGNGCEIYVCNYLSREYLDKMPKTVARMKAFDKLSDEQAFEMITGRKLPQS